MKKKISKVNTVDLKAQTLTQSVVKSSIPGKVSLLWRARPNPVLNQPILIKAICLIKFNPRLENTDHIQKSLLGVLVLPRFVAFLCPLLFSLRNNQLQDKITLFLLTEYISIPCTFFPKIHILFSLNSHELFCISIL